MHYFGGLNFLSWGCFPEYPDFIVRGMGDNPEFEWYALQYNYSGKLRFSVGKRKLRTYEGPYAWITVPHEKCQYGAAPGTTRHHRHVGFFGPRTKRFIDMDLMSGEPMAAPIPITRPDRFARQFDEMIVRLNNQRVLLAVHLLEGLLLSLQFQPPASSSDHLTPGIRKLAQAMIDHPGHPWDFHEEARKMCVSYAHFRRIFQQAIHMPPGQYLQGCRLQRAAEMLRTGTTTIADVSAAVGIPDIHYFTRLFSRQYKMPPVKYRQHLYEVTGQPPE